MKGVFQLLRTCIGLGVLPLVAAACSRADLPASASVLTLIQESVSIKETFEVHWHRFIDSQYHNKETKVSPGINPKSSFVKVKEYGGRVDRELVANRINSEKSTYAAYFGTGSLSGSVFCTGSANLRDYTVETRLRVPTTASSLVASMLSGTIWTLERDLGNESLRWERTSFSSETGSLILSLSQSALTCSNVVILNDKWYNIAVSKETTTGSYKISVKKLDVDEITYSTSSYFASSSISGLFQQINSILNF